MMVRIGQSARSVAEALFATILLQNGLHRDEDCSIFCTTRKVEIRFGFNYLQFMGLCSKFPELAFNQWVAGSSSADWSLLFRGVFRDVGGRFMATKATTCEAQ